MIDGNFLHVPIEFLLNSSLYIYCPLFSALRVPERNFPRGEALPPSQPAWSFSPTGFSLAAHPLSPVAPAGMELSINTPQHSWETTTGKGNTKSLAGETGPPVRASQAWGDCNIYSSNADTLAVTGTLRMTKMGQQHTARLSWAPGLCGQPGALPGPDPREPTPSCVRAVDVSSSLCGELRRKRSLAQRRLQSNVGGGGCWDQKGGKPRTNSKKEGAERAAGSPQEALIRQGRLSVWVSLRYEL